MTTDPRGGCPLFSATTLAVIGLFAGAALFLLLGWSLARTADAGDHQAVIDEPEVSDLTIPVEWERDRV